MKISTVAFWIQILNNMNHCQISDKRPTISYYYNALNKSIRLNYTVLGLQQASHYEPSSLRFCFISFTSNFCSLILIKFSAVTEDFREEEQHQALRWTRTPEHVLSLSRQPLPTHIIRHYSHIIQWCRYNTNTEALGRTTAEEETYAEEEALLEDH